MPGRFLSDADRARLSTFPKEATEEDLIAYFTLSADDLTIIRRWRGEHNRFGFALQLCTLRFLGFVPDDLTRAPKSIVAYLASQLGTDPTRTPTRRRTDPGGKMAHGCTSRRCIAFRGADDRGPHRGPRPRGPRCDR